MLADNIARSQTKISGISIAASCDIRKGLAMENDIWQNF
jgi:hypothetical protein